MKLSPPFTVVMADDDDDDKLLAQDAMEAAGSSYQCLTVGDGKELLDLLRHEGKYTNLPVSTLPSVILLDLNMPILDGRETLRQLKQDNVLNSIPVVILSTSENEDDINLGYKLGAASYMVKPNDFDSLVKMMKSFNEYWFDSVALPVITPEL